MDIQTLTRTLWPEGSGPDCLQAYALLDCARDEAIAPAIWQSNLPSTCLYAGKLSRSLERAAPHLVQLTPESRFCSTLVNEGWGQAWGLYLVAAPDVSLQALRKHCRTLTRVTDEQGRILLFRFYDPRVLRAYLPACTPTEVQRLCGPVDRIVLEPAVQGDAPMVCAPPQATAWPGSAARRPAMVQIRTAQVDALRSDLVTRFKQRLIEHAQTHCPVQCDHAGADAVVATVELGMRLAREGGLRSRRDVARYLNLMWMLGSFFETDPGHRHLFDGAPSDPPSGRLDLAMQRAMDHLDAVHGPDNQRLVRMLMRLLKLDVAGLPCRSDLGPWLAAIAPACHERDPDAVAQAVRQAQAAISRRPGDGGINEDATLALVAVCTLLLGGAFDADPQFPWAREALAASGAQAPQALLSGMQSYARALLAGKNRD